MPKEPTNNGICVSPVWAKELERAGWPQDESVFYWVKYWNAFDKKTKYSLNRYRDEDDNVNPQTAAPTAEEILRRLPYSITEDRNGNLTICDLTVRPVLAGGWAVFYKRRAKRRPKLCSEIGDTLANAAAAMWIYLSDNNLLPG